MRVILVTGNPHKAREAQRLLAGHPVEIHPLDLPETQTMDADRIAREKIEHAARHLSAPDAAVIVEDVSFWIGKTGLPGPLMKYFEQALGAAGLARFAQAFGDDTAVAECRIGLKRPGQPAQVILGTARGRVVEPQGRNGFGFDPVFVPDGHDQTFAQMAPEEKDRVSHRGRAYAQLRNILNE